MKKDASMMKKSARTVAQRVGRSTVVARRGYACDGRVLDVTAVRYSERGVLTGLVKRICACMEGHRRRYRVSEQGGMSPASDERKSPGAAHKYGLAIGVNDLFFTRAEFGCLPPGCGGVGSV